MCFNQCKQCDDSGYQIQETKPHEFYDWHTDSSIKQRQLNEVSVRNLTYLWYLNTVDQGGETEFYDGTKISPERGKLLLFPATWTFYHRGRPPLGNKNKYVCTGWLRDIIVINDDDDKIKKFN